MVTSPQTGSSVRCVRRARQHRVAPTLIVGVALTLAGAAILLGTLGTAAQTAPPAARPIASLKTVPVPLPPNLGDFLIDPTPGSPSMVAATQLGKALFWDMQIGSDGVQACASCHCSAGADARTINQVSPGLLSSPPDVAFQVGGGPNATLSMANFPLHQLQDTDSAQSAVIRDSHDIVGSQGVFRRDFVDAASPLLDTCTRVADADGFSIGGVNVRRVEPRHAPSVINAVFNFRNFWDGRAQNHFNGVSAFGDRDPAAVLLKTVGGVLQPVHVSIANASLASQAVGPPRGFFEMSCDGRAFPEIRDRRGTDSDDHAGLGRRLHRRAPTQTLARDLRRAHAPRGVVRQSRARVLAGVFSLSYRRAPTASRWRG